MKEVWNAGNVIWVAEDIGDQQFSYFSVNFNFGSDQDPKGKRGLAHLLEHVLSFSLKDSVDTFVFRHSDAWTNHRCIQLQFVIPVKETISTIQKIQYQLLNNPIDKKVFENQRLKVIYEIAKVKKAEGILEIEEYERINPEKFMIIPSITEGIAAEVAGIALCELEGHYYKCLETYGMTMSLISTRQIITSIRELDLFFPYHKKNIQFKNEKNTIILTNNESMVQTVSSAYRLYMLNSISADEFVTLKLIKESVNLLLNKEILYLIAYSEGVAVYKTNSDYITRQIDILTQEDLLETALLDCKHNEEMEFLYNPGKYENWLNICYPNPDLRITSWIDRIQNVSVDRLKEFVDDNIMGRQS